MEFNTLRNETYFEFEDKEYIVQFEIDKDLSPVSFDPISGSMAYMYQFIIGEDMVAVYTLDEEYVPQDQNEELYEIAIDKAEKML